MEVFCNRPSAVEIWEVGVFCYVLEILGLDVHVWEFLWLHLLASLPARVALCCCISLNSTLGMTLGSRLTSPHCCICFLCLPWAPAALLSSVFWVSARLLLLPFFSGVYSFLDKMFQELCQVVVGFMIYLIFNPNGIWFCMWYTLGNYTFVFQMEFYVLSKDSWSGSN